MTNAPTILQLFERQAKAAKAAKAQVAPSQRTAAGKLPPLAGPFAQNVASAARQSRKASTPTRPSADAAKAPRKAAAKPAASRSFAHLTPAPFEDEDFAPRTGNASASAIVTAAAKARSVVPVGKPGQATLAASVLAAGRAARTPTGTRAPAPTGLAADIIAAGKKRRAISGAKS
jgi:hypothetical protein